MKICVINGPNLDKLGKRQPDIYGQTSYDKLVEHLQSYAAQKGIELEVSQTNIEGEIIDMLDRKCDAFILNAGGYSHTSVAIRDAVAAIETPVYEVHISNIYTREEFRRVSLLSEVCTACICGFGVYGYIMAIDGILNGKSI